MGCNNPITIEIKDNKGNNKTVERHKVGFKYRPAETKQGEEVLLATDAVYSKDKITGALIRRDRSKPGKAAKRALKRDKVKAMKAANA